METLFTNFRNTLPPFFSLVILSSSSLTLPRAPFTVLCQLSLTPRHMPHFSASVQASLPAAAIISRDRAFTGRPTV